MNKLAWLAGLAAIVAGCGGKVVASGGPGAGGSGTGGSGTAGPCPASEPTGGEACSATDGFRCTYGDSVRADCRHDWLCYNGAWTTTKSICLEPSPDQCNFSEPPAGQVCPTEGVFCTIGQTLCACSSCLNGPCQAPPITWQCAGPPSTPGCPPIVPNDGSACDAPGAQCSYGFICGGSGAQVACKNGLWTWDQTIACAD